MAAAARAGGAEIQRFNRVTGIARKDDAWAVETEKGTILAEHVVNAAGCFADRVGAMVGLKVPFVNVKHHYIVTEALPEIAALGDHALPVTRDPGTSCYYRREHDGLIIGIYETDTANIWNRGGVDWSFDQELLPEELDRISPWLEKVMDRMPAFGRAGIKRVVNGPITHSPDAASLIGPAPGLANFWMCCASSYGVTQGGGVGHYLAQWMVEGDCELATMEFDPRRFGDWAVGDYCAARAQDDYHQNYQVAWPNEFREAGRPLFTSPLYARLKEKGAQMSDAHGWERARVFSEVPETHTFRRSNLFDTVGAEVRAVAGGVGVADLTSFAKFEVEGPDAERYLARVTCGRIPRIGRVSLGHALSPGGRILSEFTLARLSEDRFYLTSAITGRVHDGDWLQKSVCGDDVSVRDVTDDVGMLLVTGPRARDLLATLTPQPLGSDDFPWLSVRETEVAGIPVRALRVSYVGELGWELHHPIDRMPALYDAIEAGGVTDFGVAAIGAIRMEKAYAAWGHELTNEITPVEAGTMRFVDLGRDFTGRDAVMAREAEGPRGAIVFCEVDAGDADALGAETCLAGERVIGVSTSGGYGYRVGRSLAFAYVDPAFAAPGTAFDMLILGERRQARVLPGPAYDPDNLRLKA
jgi:dimethylglycine dehydrogenase